MEGSSMKCETFQNNPLNGDQKKFKVNCIEIFKFDSYEHPAFKACWDLSNLQPLWATTKIAISYGESNNYIGNREKGNRIIITKEIQNLLDSVNI